MTKFSHSQLYALRAARSATMNMLVPVGKHYSTSFLGGPRINASTVQSLIALDLMRRVEGSNSAVLTAKGTEAATQAALEDAQANAVAAAKRDNKHARYRLRNPQHKPTPAPENFTRRLPYVD